MKVNQHAHQFQIAAAINANETLRPFSQVVTVTTSGNLKDYNTVLVNAAGGAVTLTLPRAADATCAYFVKKIDASANAVTIDGYSAETIDGTATKSTTTQWTSYSLASNGVAWYLF